MSFKQTSSRRSRSDIYKELGIKHTPRISLGKFVSDKQWAEIYREFGPDEIPVIQRFLREAVRTFHDVDLSSESRDKYIREEVAEVIGNAFKIHDLNFTVTGPRMRVPP